MVADLHQLVSTELSGPVILIGHSVGGFWQDAMLKPTPRTWRVLSCLMQRAMRALRS